MRIGSLAAAAAVIALSSCQSQTQGPTSTTGKSAALRAMEQVATAAYRCWFDSKDKAFASYSFANELNSFSGRPRFLLVPKNDFGGRPLLVVQAEGADGRVTAFGPLMEGEHANRVTGDIDRWRMGNQSCENSA